MFTDASGEDQQVQSAQNRDESTERLFCGAAKNVNRLLGGGIGWQLMELAHVPRNSGDSQEPRLRIEQLLEIIRLNSLRSDYVEQHTGVEISGTRAHYDAAGGSEPHGRIDGSAV